MKNSRLILYSSATIVMVLIFALAFYATATENMQQHPQLKEIIKTESDTLAKTYYVASADTNEPLRQRISGTDVWNDLRLAPESEVRERGFYAYQYGYEFEATKALEERLTYGKTTEASIFQLGNMLTLYDANDVDKLSRIADRLTENYVRLRPDSTFDKIRQLSYLNVAQSVFDEHSFDLADSFVDTVLSKSPENIDFILLKAGIFSARENNDAALQLLENIPTKMTQLGETLQITCQRFKTGGVQFHH